MYNIYEYELALLNKKIRCVNEKLQANEKKEGILQMRQAIVNDLIDLYQRRSRRKYFGFKRKQDLINKSKELYDFPLVCDLERNDIVWAKRKFHGRDYFFPLIIRDGQYKCLNQNYEDMYKLLLRLD